MTDFLGTQEEYEAYAREADRLTTLADTAVETARATLSRAAIQAATSACHDAAAMHSRADNSHRTMTGLNVPRHTTGYARFVELARSLRALRPTTK